MANLKDVKSDVFGTINSFRVLVNDYPKLKTNNSYSSINNSNDPIDFIIDLFNSLGGIEDLQSILTDILVNQLDQIEAEVKESVKSSIKEYISCNIEPSVTDENIRNGIDIPLKDVDLFNQMRKSPLDDDGGLYYFDVDNNLSKSTDFNVFFYSVVNNQNNGNNIWGKHQDVWKNDILTLSFTENGNTTSDDGKVLHNYITVNMDKYYNTNGNDSAKKLMEFNSDYINSVKFFDSKNLTTKIIDKIFGVLKSSNKRTKDELLLESQVEVIIDRLSNAEDDVEIDDSYFSFSNEQYNQLQRQAELKKIGVNEYNGDTTIGIQIKIEDLLTTIGNIDENTNLIEQTKLVNDCFEEVINSATENSNEKFSFKTNLIKSLIKELTMSLTMIIASPKVYTLLAVNTKLLGLKYPTDINSFFSENQNLISNVTKSIKDIVLGILMKKIIKLANGLITNVGAELLKEQLLKQKKYMLSLLPINI